jgi:hypothetical protein
MCLSLVLLSYGWYNINNTLFSYLFFFFLKRLILLFFFTIPKVYVLKVKSSFNILKFFTKPQLAILELRIGKETSRNEHKLKALYFQSLGPRQIEVPLRGTIYSCVCMHACMSICRIRSVQGPGSWEIGGDPLGQISPPTGPGSQGPHTSSFFQLQPSTERTSVLSK